MELANFLGAGPERDRHLSRHVAVGAGADHRDRAVRLDHCAGVRVGGWRAAHAAVEAGVLAGFAWVEFFRNMPLLVQLFLWFFVLPELLPHAAGLWLKQIPDAPFYTAAIGIGLFMSARVAEQLRAGIGSLPRGQKMARPRWG